MEVKKLLKLSAISVGAVMVLPSTTMVDMLLSLLKKREDIIWFSFDSVGLFLNIVTSAKEIQGFVY